MKKIIVGLLMCGMAVASLASAACYDPYVKVQPKDGCAEGMHKMANGTCGPCTTSK